MNGTIEGFASALLKFVRSERELLVATMARGAMNNFDEYRSCFGQIQMLDTVENRIKQLIAIGADDEF